MLELDRITLRWEQTLGLDAVSVQAEAGARVMVLGPSGAGKSTLLKVIAGLEAPSHGALRLDGRSLLELSPERREVVYMAQRAALFDWLSVEDNVAFGLKMRGVEAKARALMASQALSWVGLEGFERRAVGTLSGGQAQRVALARALVLKPRVLLLDEPMSSLDAPLRQQLEALIVELQAEQGFMWWWVTHDVAQALVLGTQLVLLSQGKLIASGSPRQLWERRKEDAALAALLDVGALERWTKWASAP